MKKKRNIIAALTAFLILGTGSANAIWGLDSVHSAAGEKIISALTVDLSGLKYHTVPVEVVAPLDNLSAKSEDPEAEIRSSTLEPLVDFVLSNAYADLAFELPCSNGVFGAMALGVLTNKFEERKELCAPLLPDHAVYSTLRFSKELTDRGGKIYGGMFSADEGVLTRDYSRNFDIISPNETSGAYYSYTNTRIYVQGKIKGRRVMFTGTLMKAPSSVSQKGALIDTKYPGLYFYSSEKGITIPGGGWMETTMDYYRAFTISVEIDENRFAFANLSWLSAGWKGINVLRTHHIYAVLKEIIAELQTYGGKGLAIDKLLECVAKCDSLTEAEINESYKKYCDFCEKNAGLSFAGIGASSYSRIFNKKDLDVPMELRRAVVLQEMVRTLKGKPSWSQAE